MSFLELSFMMLFFKHLFSLGSVLPRRLSFFLRHHHFANSCRLNFCKMHAVVSKVVVVFKNRQSLYCCWLVVSTIKKRKNSSFFWVELSSLLFPIIFWVEDFFWRRALNLEPSRAFNHQSLLVLHEKLIKFDK